MPVWPLSSGNCKTWCVSLVSAVLVLGIDKDKPQVCAVGLVPVLLFAYLDAYYLRLERGYRETYNRFVQTLRQEESTDADIRAALFTLTPTPTKESWFVPFRSASIAPFYLILLFVLALVLKSTTQVPGVKAVGRLDTAPQENVSIKPDRQNVLQSFAPSTTH